MLFNLDAFAQLYDRKRRIFQALASLRSGVTPIIGDVIGHGLFEAVECGAMTLRAE